MPDYDATIIGTGDDGLTAANTLASQGKRAVNAKKQPMVGYAKFIGRVGALAVVLGVGSAFATPGVASADTDAASSTGASANADTTANAEDGATGSVTESDTESTSTTTSSATDSAAESSSATAEATADSRSGVVQASGGANTSVKSSDGDSGTETASSDGDPTDSDVIADSAEDEEVADETVPEAPDETVPEAPDETAPDPDTVGTPPATDDTADTRQDDSTTRSDRNSATTPAIADSAGATAADVSAEAAAAADSSAAQDDSATEATVTVADEEQTAPVVEQSDESELPAEASMQTLAAQPVSGAANLLAAPVGFITGLVSTVLGMNPLLSNSPVAPPTSPTLWAVLAWVRRQVEYTFFNKTPTTNYDPAQNSHPFNGVILGNLNAVDADGDKLTYTVTEGPQHGTVVVDSAGGFTYIPSSALAAAGGTDTFTVTVDDRPGNPLHFHGLASLFDPNGAATTEAVVTVTVDPSSPIATEAQLRLEQLAKDIANSAEVQAMRETMRQHWLAVAGQKYAAIGGIDDESMARLEEALDEFTMGVALRVVNTDASRPEVFTIALPEHDWFGVSTPGGRFYYDNPDSVYRVIPVADDSSYVITGRFVGERPLDGNISVYNDVDVFAPVYNLPVKDLVVAPDGTFTITVDSSPANGRVNHIQLEDGATQLVIRDTLGDWTETPAYLEVTRVGGPEPGPAKTYEQLVDEAAALMISSGVDLYRPETDPAIFQPANMLLPPITLPGTLIGQRQSWGHFDLADNEALVVTITPGDAGYFTIPVTDIWMKTPNFWDHQSSLNSEQAIANDDGTYTIVVSKTDPGVANWVDTVGLDVGTLLVRWQLPGDNPDGGDPTVSAHVVSLDDLSNALPDETRWVTPEQRQAQLDARKEAFNQRFSPYVQL